MRRIQHNNDLTKNYLAKDDFDSEDVLNKKIMQLVKLIQSSQHFICFTGEGFSTSFEKEEKNIKTNSGLLHVPSDSHMALVTLEQQGLLQFLATQNIDGLHRRSGFDHTKLSELYGNVNLEYCQKCGQKYLRDFRTRNSLLINGHETGRFCDNPLCNGPLLDTIRNFNKTIPKKDLKEWWQNSEQADLCLVLGSQPNYQQADFWSTTDIPEHFDRNNYKLVIVNLEKTIVSKDTLKINGFCDVVLKRIMDHLKLPIPKFVFKRTFAIKKVTKKGSEGIYFRGLSDEQKPFNFFKSICVEENKKITKIIQNPLAYSTTSFKNQIAVKLQFYDIFKETNLRINVNLRDLKLKEQKYYLSYDPYQQCWMNSLENN